MLNCFVWIPFLSLLGIHDFCNFSKCLHFNKSACIFHCDLWSYLINYYFFFWWEKIFDLIFCRALFFCFIVTTSERPCVYCSTWLPLGLPLAHWVSPILSVLSVYSFLILVPGSVLVNCLQWVTLLVVLIALMKLLLELPSMAGSQVLSVARSYLLNLSLPTWTCHPVYQFDTYKYTDLSFCWKIIYLNRFTSTIGNSVFSFVCVSYFKELPKYWYGLWHIFGTLVMY